MFVVDTVEMYDVISEGYVEFLVIVVLVFDMVVLVVVIGISQYEELL